jgi:phospholipase C
VNNYDTGFAFDGTPRELGSAKLVAPPQVAPNIGTALAKAGVSWKWYSGGRIGSAIDKDLYCSICDPLTHSVAVMTSSLRANLQGVDALYRDLDDERTLPAVSFVIPPNSESGHPAYSTVAELEKFLMPLVAKVKANAAIWSRTAIVVTTDEGGGYYDSGYVQIIDFFGDGTRVPLIAISPFSKRGHVDHTYYDHTSVLKFIEHNWRLPPLSKESRDNLPNPEMRASDPYIPRTAPRRRSDEPVPVLMFLDPAGQGVAIHVRSAANFRTAFAWRQRGGSCRADPIAARRAAD